MYVGRCIGAIAKWYRQLHDKGKKYLKHHSVSMYDELDKITLENIRRIAAVTYSIDNELWRMSESQFDAVKKKMADLPRTLALLCRERWLCIACEREKFPIWAEKSKELLLSGELQQRFMKWMG